jgi:ATP-binding cassette subfamily C protein
MRFLLIIFRRYPWQTAAMLALLMLSGIVEGVGLSAMLPLLAITLGNTQGGTMGSGKQATEAERMVREVFETIGLTPTLEILLLFIFATMVLKVVFVWIANKRVGFTVARLTTDLRHRMLRAFMLARWEFHLNQPVGRLSTALMGETIRTARAYAVGVTIIIAVIQAIIYVGVALMVSWKVTLIALAAGAFFAYPLNQFVKKARWAGKRQVKLRKSMNAKFVDSFQSIKPLKAMAREERAESILITKTNKIQNALQKEIISKESLSAAQETIKVTFMLAAIYVTISILGMTPTIVLVLILLLGRILGKMGKIQKQYQTLGHLESGYWSMTETYELARKMREQKLGDRKPELKKTLCLKGVTFAYKRDNVLDDASLVFPAGQISAIVGPSGAGKTTIVDLVIGLLRPQSGEVWVDDLPLAQIDLHQWRSMIGYVPQETLLLRDSIYANVTLRDPDIKEHEVEEALHKAGIWEFVQTLPKGMQSSVGQRGLKLSGGQRQRIAIARALVRKPRLLILDEATTALDPETEAAICQTLRKLRGDITILAISHQPAVMEVADCAYQIQDGTATPVVGPFISDGHLEEAPFDSVNELQPGTATEKAIYK